jgi:hypothetical protein
MEQGFTGAGSANGVSGEHVIRPGEEGSHAMAGYESTDGGPVAGWKKVDDVAGQIGPDGVGSGHFSENAAGGTGNAGPWKQT